MASPIEDSGTSTPGTSGQTEGSAPTVEPNPSAPPGASAPHDIEALEAELERYRSFIRLSDAAIWCFEFNPPIPIPHDPSEADEAFDLAIQRGKLVECNDTLARMYGYASSDELIGTPLSDFLASSPQNFQYIRKFWEQGFQLHDGESEEVHKDGTTRSFLNNLIGIFDDRQLKQVWGTQRDITERKHLEAQLLEAQRMEAVGQLAGGIAHDFNNMLMVIAGNLGVVLEQSELAAEDADALQEAQRAAERATELTRQLLTFSRRTLVRRESVELQSIVHSVFRMLRRVVHENIRFEFDLDASVPPVFADRSEIEQMLVNLVVNARDAMPEGGRLGISLSAETDAGGAIWVVLRVSDTGTGMDPETRSRIFEPFFTSKDRSTGTGLGLSVVYGIVKRSGGTIEAISELGKGTTFVVRFPASRSFTAVEPDTPEVKAPQGRRATVLLLEDRRDVLLLVRRFLEASGHHVLSAEHPDVAFALARQHHGTIDILLCDVVMPGANGAEFAQSLLKISPKTRVILMSGYADIPELSQHLAWGARFMTKPFSRAELDEEIQQALADED